jgi:hypothetical protein
MRQKASKGTSYPFSLGNGFTNFTKVVDSASSISASKLSVSLL